MGAAGEPPPWSSWRASTSSLLQNQHWGCSASSLLSDSQMCLMPWCHARLLGAVGPQPPLPKHQQPPQIHGPGLQGGSECLWPLGPGPDCHVCPTWMGREKVRCFPDLTWPALQGASTWVDSVLWAPPQRSSWTSDVEAQVARGAPAEGFWFRPVRQADLEALPRPGGARSSSTRATLP